MNGVGQTATLTKIGARFPSMAHLFTRPVDVHSALLPAHFVNRDCLLTAGVILYDGRGVILIEPTRAPNGAGVHVFPQEKAKYITDTTFAQVIRRGLREELGLTERDFALYPESISWFENHIPRRRFGGTAKTKTIVYFLAHVKGSAILRPNPKEVRQVLYASSCDDYLAAAHGIERSRHHKWVGQTDAMIAAAGAAEMAHNRWGEFREMAAHGRQNVQ